MSRFLSRALVRPRPAAAAGAGGRVVPSPVDITVAYDDVAPGEGAAGLPAQAAAPVPVAGLRLHVH